MSEELKQNDESPRSPHHVLDELKSVLSSLGRPAAPSAPVEPLSESPVAETKPPVFPTSDSILKPAIPPPSPASDADFWRGNVLGWPTGQESIQKDHIPSSVPAPSAVPVVPEPILPSISIPVASASPELPPIAFANPLDAPVTAPVTIEDVCQAPTPAPKPVLPPDPPAPTASQSVWPIDDMLPAPPVPPSSPPTLPVESFDQSIPSFPVPQTVEQSSPPDVDVLDENVLAAVETTKPENVIQLACFFPEGQEKAGQQFSKQLRDQGANSAPSMTVEPVLVSSWSADTIDTSAWAKSAQLSGADVMFILAARKDIPLFSQSKFTGAAPLLPVRIIALEHIALRTLYADILLEAKRKL